jgi:hypothetical protein
MLFEIKGTFEADGVDDALRFLAVHFTAVSAGFDTDVSLLGKCDIEINPVEENE